MNHRNSIAREIARELRGGNMPKPKPTKPKSLYTVDGSYLKNFPVAETVGELMESLAKMPKDLPLMTPMEPVWYNVGIKSSAGEECMGFRDGEDE